MISLNDMAELAKSLVEAQELTKKTEQLLKDVKERERVLVEETIPGALQELGVKELTLDTGEVISLKQEVYASLTEERKPAAFKWLDEHKFGGMIKTDLTISYAKADYEEAKEKCKELMDEGLSPTLEQSVHAQTLKAFIKEQIATVDPKVPFPLDLFGARVVFQAKIKTK